MKYNESKYGNKTENHYSHKIFTRTNQIESKYGNKIGSENNIISHQDNYIVN